MVDASPHLKMRPLPIGRWIARWVCGLGLVAPVLALAPPACAAEALATVTVQQGKASVIRGTTRLESLPGARLAAEDIVETAPTASLVRIEFDKGSLLDMGPSTRVMLMPGNSLAYVLQGWVKLTTGPASPSASLGLATAAMDVSTVGRAVVLHVQGTDAEAFAESGAVAVLINGQTKPPVNGELQLAPGHFLARHGDAPASVMARPSAAFIQSVPGAFMDTLPARAPLYKGKDAAMSPGKSLNHAEVQPWLEAEPRIRQRFTTRWRPLLQDLEFKRALAAHLNAHPEWRPILHPPRPVHQRTSP